MKRGTKYALICGAIPFITLVFALPLVNRIKPVILGLPFILFWILVLFGATLVAKNIYKTGFNPRASDEKVMRLSRMMVLVIMTFSLFFAILFPNELVNLLILGYDGVSQFFPGVVFGLFWKRVRKTAVFWGILTGVGIVALLILSGNDPFYSINAGFVGLSGNTLVTVLISLRAKSKEVLDVG